MLVKNISGGTTTRYAFLKFDLTSITGTVSNASMTLFGVSGNTLADAVSSYAVADTTWTESGLTYGNMPLIGSSLNSSVSVSGATLTPYSWSGLASYINAHRGGLVTIALEMTNTPSTGAADSFNTKEAASNTPLLNVTYTPGPNVVTPASASPNPVTSGLTTSVSVLGADPAGEASLTYTWSATGPASVAFSPNGTNAAKASTATFTATGAYTLTATITDGGGQSTTSSVNVTVGSSGGTTTALPTVADTYVQQGTPTTNYGTVTTMLVKNVSGGTTTRYTFLKFDLTSITGLVTNATMTLSGVSTNTTADTVAAFGDTGTTWTETGLTYGNMPAIGSALSSTVSISGATLTPYTWTGLSSGDQRPPGRPGDNCAGADQHAVERRRGLLQHQGSV